MSMHNESGSVLGRKNYLFAGADSGERAAAIYSLIGSAKLNGPSAAALQGT